MNNPETSLGDRLDLFRTLMLREVPGQLVIQLTDRCNALCPQCGMRKTEAFPRSTLPVDDVKRMIDRAAENGIKVISFTGGEPLLLLNDLVLLANHAGSAGIKYIRTGTNGFVFSNSHRSLFYSRVTRLAERLAATPIRNLWISIDSAIPAIHEEMRGLPGVIKGIEKAIPIFHEHGIYPSANLGINRNIGGELTKRLRRGPSSENDSSGGLFYEAFRTAFQDFYRFVVGLGFTIVNCCYPMSSNYDQKTSDLKPVYAATSEDRVVTFSRREKALLFQAALDTIPEFRSKIRIFSPRTSLYALIGQYTEGPQKAYPCRGGIDFFFVSCEDGNVYPCGYRGDENLGKYWNMDRKALKNGFACYQCDWECFRDPSELFGPLLHVLSDPFGFLKRIRRDARYFRLWIDDLKYYRACDLFDGRKPPDLARLRAL